MSTELLRCGDVSEAQGLLDARQTEVNTKNESKKATESKKV